MAKAAYRSEDMDRLAREEIWKETGIMMLIFEALVAWVRECGDPGSGPEPEADYKLIGEKLLGVPDEILVLKRARILNPVDVRTQDVPGEQTTVAVEASVLVMATLAKRKRTKALIMVFSSISKRSEHLRW